MAGRRKSPAARSKAHREFVSEAEEILERMREDLARLAERSGAGGEVDPELVNGLFRSAHSLKGLSGMFGLDGIFTPDTNTLSGMGNTAAGAMFGGQLCNVSAGQLGPGIDFVDDGSGNPGTCPP